MQKIFYLSNSRDYTNQDNVNENRYFKQINKLMEQGWSVDQVIKIVTNTVALDNDNSQDNKESFAAFVLLEKPDEQK